MPLNFSTKAKTLDILKNKLLTARIAPLIYFTVKDWGSCEDSCLDLILSQIGQNNYIVRSSCGREDNHSASNAGAFESILNVSKDDLKCSIEKVISSYGSSVCETDQILVQPMLQNVVSSGVAFSHDPNTSAPYRVINWSNGENTAAITGGLSGKTWYQSMSTEVAAPQLVQSVTILIDELLTIFDGQPIDCEFAITHEEDLDILWLLQVRPLILNEILQDDEEHRELLQTISDKVSTNIGNQPFLLGKRTLFGVMPDWNPAEIIGVRPRPLALSLYREIITDSIWAYQRHNYGYRNLRSFPLMTHFAGLPYIDVRVSFNSFIPAELDDNIATRLVDYYLEKLIQYPNLHDKVEFDVVFSCYTFDLKERISSLGDFGFSEAEIDKIVINLKDVTNKIINPKFGLPRQDAKKLDVLKKRRDTILAATSDPIDRIYWLIEDCKRYGSLPFAGLARAGFVAVQMLESLVRANILSREDYHSFMNSLSTVSGQLARDKINMDRGTFLNKYGHLRPGTYDILSPRYDEQPDLYFSWDTKQDELPSHTPFSLELKKMREIDKLLTQNSIGIDPVGLFDFIQFGIEMRELSKFYFTKNLSDAMSLMTSFARNCGISINDLSFCDYSVFKELYIGTGNPTRRLSESICAGKRSYEDTKRVILPPLITSVNDIWAFEQPENTPNFITQNDVVASIVTSETKDKLAGAIVCIESADPGFDWLFSHRIKGLITAWGGANSHMAIRAGELGIAAAIGVGNETFRKFKRASVVRLNCAGRKMEIIK